MPKWLKAVLRFFVGEPNAQRPASRTSRPPGAASRQRSYPLIGLKEHAGEGRPERLHWKASHPSTIRRFKAEVTCSHGHGIALSNHTIEADGRVVPSIVCRTPGCDFHQVVRLEGWRAGRIPAAPAAI
ncbi:hypothetical protein BV96_01261 [Sphingomonas paucimobilis]|nr:hypothetical protein BV96_01261 [Sphingomonas paucimobilis]